MSASSAKQAVRRERLAMIADQHTTRIHEERPRAQLRGANPCSRYAAVTSEGDPESSLSGNGNLLVGDDLAELSVLLAEEVSRGWPSHGRLWDLDAHWDPWGNLRIGYRVELSPGPDTGPAAAPQGD